MSFEINNFPPAKARRLIDDLNGRSSDLGFHFTEQILTAYAKGGLPKLLERNIDKHLEQCPHCLKIAEREFEKYRKKKGWLF